MVDGVLVGGVRGWSGLGAASLFRTGGYILTAPEFRGPVDIPSNVHSQSGRVEVRREVGTEGDVFVRGNVLNEARSNGTPLQTNGTRIWRYVAGGDWTDGNADRFLVRLYGTDQSFRQSFSAINSTRTSERLTAFHVDPSQQVGGAVQWARSHRQWTFIAGGDVLDTRGTDTEELSEVSLSARQRGEGVYGEVLWTPCDVVHCVLFAVRSLRELRCEASGGKAAAAAEYQRECLQSAAWSGEEDQWSAVTDWVGVSGFSWADDE